MCCALARDVLKRTYTNIALHRSYKNQDEEKTYLKLLKNSSE